MDIYQILRVQKTADRKELQAKYLRMLDSYQMTATFAEDRAVSEIARRKIEQLIAAGKEYGLDNEYFESNTTTAQQTNISSIKLALNSSECSVDKLRESNMLDRISALPESAEKHYLKSVVMLRIDSSFRGCRDAITELDEALNLDPTNEAYIGLLDAITEQVQDYEQRQKEKADKEERERLERERKSQEALDAAKEKEFLDSAAGCIFGCGVPLLMCCCIWKCLDESGCC